MAGLLLLMSIGLTMPLCAQMFNLQETINFPSNFDSQLPDSAPGESVEFASDQGIPGFGEIAAPVPLDINTDTEAPIENDNGMTEAPPTLPPLDSINAGKSRGEALKAFETAQTAKTKPDFEISFYLEYTKNESMFEDKKCVEKCQAAADCAAAMFCPSPPDEGIATEEHPCPDGPGSPGCQFQLPLTKRKGEGICYMFKESSTDKIPDNKDWGKDWRKACKTVVYHPGCRNTIWSEVPSTWEKTGAPFLTEKGVQRNYECRSGFQQNRTATQLHATCDKDRVIDASTDYCVKKANADVAVSGGGNAGSLGPTSGVNINLSNNNAPGNMVERTTTTTTTGIPFDFSNCDPRTISISHKTAAPKMHWYMDDFCHYYVSEDNSTDASFMCRFSFYNTPGNDDKKDVRGSITEDERRNMECGKLCEKWAEMAKEKYPQYVVEEASLNCYYYGGNSKYFNWEYFNWYNEQYDKNVPFPYFT